MLYYRAPKSQLWGHRVGRLSAEEVLDRAEQFVRDKCTVEKSALASFSVIWTPCRSPQLAASVATLQSSLTAQSQAFGCTNRYREPATELRWTLNDADMCSAARWLDGTFEKLGAEESHATLTKFVTFRWREVPSGADTKSGGMFGYNLAKPRAVTTMFAFESIAHYEAIKEYLARIGLAMLSDKRLKESSVARRRAR